jgi:hypothetical protein
MSATLHITASTCCHFVQHSNPGQHMLPGHPRSSSQPQHAARSSTLLIPNPKCCHYVWHSNPGQHMLPCHPCSSSQLWQPAAVSSTLVIPNPTCCHFARDSTPTNVCCCHVTHAPLSPSPHAATYCWHSKPPAHIYPCTAHVYTCTAHVVPPSLS